jgi:hypothetical protein
MTRPHSGQTHATTFPSSSGLIGTRSSGQFGGEISTRASSMARAYFHVLPLCQSWRMNVALDWYKASIPLAWPIVVVALVVVLRNQIAALLGDMVEATVAGNTFKFRRTGNKVRKVLEETGTPEQATGVANSHSPGSLKVSGEASFEANTDMPSYTSGSNYPPGTPLRLVYAERAVENPLNAILEAYLHLEAWFDRTLTSHQLSPWSGYVKKGVPEMTVDAYNAGLISDPITNTIRGLGIMRDLAIKKRDNVKPEEAEEYLLLVDGTIYALNNEVRAYDEKKK